MGALSNFLGKAREVEINGEKIIINPLKVGDLKKLEFKENATKEESEKMGKELILLSINDVTNEEIDNLPVNAFVKIMNEINKLNGFTDERLNKFKENAR